MAVVVISGNKREIPFGNESGKPARMYMALVNVSTALIKLNVFIGEVRILPKDLELPVGESVEVNGVWLLDRAKGKVIASAPIDHYITLE